MGAATAISRRRPAGGAAKATTLLALVRAIGDVTDDEQEVIATVLHMLRNGEVRLCGNFSGASSEDFE